MRKILTRFGTALIAFGIGLGAFWLRPTLQTLRYCEVARNSERYHNRNIRVKATVFIGVSRIYIAEDCDPIEALITVVERDGSTYLGEQGYENWSITTGNSGIKKVQAVIEGRFSVISNGCWGPKYKLVATKIEALSGRVAE